MRASARVAVAGTVAALGLGLVGAVNLATPERAGAVESETYPLPAGGAWSVAGKGFGHGRGMSQWGSQGAAMRGLTGTQILAFYYPSTVTTTIPAASIRVMISGDEGVDTSVGAQSGLAVRDVSTSLLYSLPAGPQRWRGVHDGAGMHIDSWDGSTWTRWTAPDGRSTWQVHCASAPAAPPS